MVGLNTPEILLTARYIPRKLSFTWSPGMMSSPGLLTFSAVMVTLATRTRR